MNRKPFFKQLSPYLVLAIIFLPLYAFEFFKGGNNGLLFNWYISRLLLRVLMVTFIIHGVTLLIKNKKTWVRTVAYNVLVFLGFIFFIEILAFLYTTLVDKEITRPSHILLYDNPEFNPNVPLESRLWGDMDDSVGRWRLPDKTVEHISCEDSSKIIYSTNSIGSRDQERTHQEENQIIFLGDSFVEGFYVNAKDRMTNILEANTKIQHLNFGITGASPLSYYLIYNRFAKNRYIHNKIIIGLFIENDFETFGAPVNSGFLNMPIYRPFLQGRQIKYTLAQRSQSFAYYSNNTIETIRATRDSLYHAQTLSRKIWLEFETNSYLVNWILDAAKKTAIKNYKEQFVSNLDNPEWDTPKTQEFQESLKRLITETADKNVLLLIIPSMNDIKNFQKNHTNLYTPYIQENFTLNGKIKVIDLVPLFSMQAHPEQFYIPCDGHWNPEGNKLAADYLLNDPIYREFIK